MLKYIQSSLLTGVFLLTLVAQSYAQDAEPAYKREVHLGTTLGNGFNPRFIYKKVNEKSVTRYVLKLNAGNRTTDTELFGSGSVSSITQRTFNADIALGMGLEWRAPISKRFQVYYGGDLELLYSISGAKNSRVEEFSATEITERESSNRNHQPGVALGGFGGFRFNMTERLAFSVEAGPRIQALLSLREDNDLIVTNPGLPDEDRSETSISTTNFNGTFNIISPLYVQFALLF